MPGRSGSDRMRSMSCVWSGMVWSENRIPEMEMPSRRAKDNLSAEAVETFQVLYDTLGSPRGPRNVSAGGQAGADGKVRPGHAKASVSDVSEADGLLTGIG